MLNTARTEHDRAVVRAVAPTKLDQQNNTGYVTGRESLDALVDASQKNTTVKILEKCAE